MEKLSFEHAIRVYIERAGLDRAEVSRDPHHTPMQFNIWLQHVNLLADMIIHLAQLLDLTEDERVELFSLACYGVAIDSADKPVPTNQPEQKNGGGRPRDEDNDWAFEQVFVLNRSCGEVYQEWLARRKEHGKFMQLADPYDSFKKAISARRKKGKKGINLLSPILERKIIEPGTASR